jgi:hypothetical protein
MKMDGYDLLRNEMPAVAVLAFASEGNTYALEEMSIIPPMGDQSIGDFAREALREVNLRRDCAKYASEGKSFDKPIVPYRPKDGEPMSPRFEVVSQRKFGTRRVYRAGEEMSALQEIMYAKMEG